MTYYLSYHFLLVYASSILFSLQRHFAPLAVSSSRIEMGYKEPLMWRQQASSPTVSVTASVVAFMFSRYDTLNILLDDIKVFLVFAPITNGF